MMILGLELDNVKSYEQASIEFTPGVNAIVGHNGAGKSTIVEAIGFVLFDALSYTQAEFIRAGAKSASATVAFLSAMDERRYEVTRRLGSSSQIFVTDPELQTRICEGRADVERFLYEHMRLEPGTNLRALYNDAVGVPQGTLTAAFLFTEANRRPIFDRLLQLDDYKTAADRLREPVRLVRERLGALETTMAGASARLERLDGLRAEVDQDRKRLTELEASRREVQGRLDAVSRRRTELEAAQAAAQAAEQALQATVQQVDALTRQQEGAALALREAEAAHAAVAANAEGHAAYLRAQTEQRGLDERVEARRGVREELGEVNKQQALCLADLQRAEAELAEIEQARTLAQSLAGAVSEQNELEQRLVQAQREAARLEDAEKQVQQYASACSRLENRRAELEKSLAESAELERERARQVAQQETLRGQADAHRSELAALKTKADAIKEQSEALGQETALCPVCEQPLAEAQRASLLARNDAELARLRRRYAEAQSQMKDQDAQAEQLRARIDQLEARLRRAARAEELTQVVEELAHTQRMQEQAQTTAEALRGADATIGKLEQALRALGNPKQRHAVAAAQVERESSIAARRTGLAEQQQQLETRSHSLRQALAGYDDLDEALQATRAALQTHHDAYLAVVGNQKQAELVPARRQTLEEIQAQLANCRATLEARRSEAAQAGAAFDATAYGQAREEEQALRTQMGVQESEERFVRERLARQEAEVKSLEKLAQELVQMQEQQGTLQKQERALEKIRTLLNQARPHIARALVRRVSETAEQIFGDIMQDYSRHLQWDEGYNVTLRVDDHERQFSQLSGGEQMSAALSVRLALLREMSNIAVAFFDEPTANLDETRRESLARQILQIRGFRQLFVISHDDTFEQATQNLIRVERVDGASRVYVG